MANNVASIDFWTVVIIAESSAMLPRGFENARLDDQRVCLGRLLTTERFTLDARMWRNQTGYRWSVSGMVPNTGDLTVSFETASLKAAHLHVILPLELPRPLLVRNPARNPFECA